MARAYFQSNGFRASDHFFRYVTTAPKKKVASTMLHASESGAGTVPYESTVMTGKKLHRRTLAKMNHSPFRSSPISISNRRKESEQLLSRLRHNCLLCRRKS